MSIYEYQVYSRVVGWCAPSVDDACPAFADKASGRSCNRPGLHAYQVVLDEQSDPAGFRYATAFGRLDAEREGGRTYSRLTDTIRRREWKKDAATVLGLRDKANSAVAQWAAVDMLRDMMLHHMRHRSITDIVSIGTDPSTFYRLRNNHHRGYDEWISTLQRFDDDKGLLKVTLASLFARAVYGQPMAEGACDKCSTWIAGSATRFISGASEEKDTKAFLSLTSLQQEHLLFTSWADDAYHPAFCVARVDSVKWIVVAIRGTLSVKDVLTDMAVHNQPFLTGHAHAGVFQASCHVLLKVLPVLYVACQDFPDYQVVFTGHSLGAATSAVCAMMIRARLSEAVWNADIQASPSARVHADDAWKFPDVDTSQWQFKTGPVAYTIAIPPVVTPELARHAENYIICAQRGKDWICRLSLFGVDHLIKELSHESLGSKVYEGVLTAVGFAEKVEARRKSMGKPEDHMVPPGIVIQVNNRPTSEHPKAFRAASQDYDHLLLAFRMVEDHLPNLNVAGLLEICEDRARSFALPEDGEVNSCVELYTVIQTTCAKIGFDAEKAYSDAIHWGGARPAAEPKGTPQSPRVYMPAENSVAGDESGAAPQQATQGQPSSSSWLGSGISVAGSAASWVLGSKPADSSQVPASSDSTGDSVAEPKIQPTETEDLCSWLEKLELARAAPTFRDHGIFNKAQMAALHADREKLDEIGEAADLTVREAKRLKNAIEELSAEGGQTWVGSVLSVPATGLAVAGSAVSWVVGSSDSLGASKPEPLAKSQPEQAASGASDPSSSSGGIIGSVVGSATSVVGTATSWVSWGSSGGYPVVAKPAYSGTQSSECTKPRTIPEVPPQRFPVIPGAGMSGVEAASAGTDVPEGVGVPLSGGDDVHGLEMPTQPDAKSGKEDISRVLESNDGAK
mmetsp:Transcript_1396/g.3056  ORF Transcript_1396/g.3056 Transcript_1396/m.3056 type:complete len:908 (-) Transcript_1396:56-2779(-)